MEYRHAIVQVFTDALLMAQFQTKQLEPKLHSGAKMFPRVLLSLNILDEFGFRPGTDQDNYYLGNPEYAHYPLYEDLLNDYGLNEQDRRSYHPSKIADQVRTFLESSYDSYIKVVALLAVAEEEVILLVLRYVRRLRLLELRLRVVAITMYMVYRLTRHQKQQMMIMKMTYGLHWLKA